MKMVWRIENSGKITNFEMFGVMILLFASFEKPGEMNNLIVIFMAGKQIESVGIWLKHYHYYFNYLKNGLVRPADQ